MALVNEVIWNNRILLCEFQTRYIKSCFRTVVFFLLLFLNIPVFPNELSVSSDHFVLSYYIDSTHVLNPQQVLQRPLKWVEVADPLNLNLGHNDYTVWLQLRLLERAQGKDYILTIENAHLDTVDVYKYKNGHANVVQTGDRRPFKNREHVYNMFSFTLPDSCDFFLLKINTQGSLSMPFTVEPINDYMVSSNIDTMMLALFFGVISLAILLNVLLYYRMHEKIYLFYILCLLGNALLNAVDSGVGFQLLWPNHPDVNQYVALFYACSVTSLLFSQNFLSLKEKAPMLNRIYYLFMLYLLVLVVINLMGYYYISIAYIVYYFYGTCLMYLLSGFYVYYFKKYKPAFYYIIAWGIYSISGAVYMLASEGVIPFTFLTKNALKIGNILEVVFLFMAVIDQIYGLREAKEQSDRETIRLVEENRIILLNKNQALEKFANFTAHNIRGPVSSIMGLVNLFPMVKDSEVETRKVLVFIRQSAQKLDEVVRDMITLLTLNNIEESEREELQLAPIYYEVKEQFVSKDAGEWQVEFDESFIGHRLYADEMILRFIMEQLMDNSYKFRHTNRPLQIRIKEIVDGQFIKVFFSDNGIGFDYEKYKEDVFGLYKRFHGNAKGKGLGLYFVKEYMQKLKGNVEIESQVGEGTTVILSFEKV